MHVIYNRLRLILLPVDGWRHVIFTFACMQTHQTQERAYKRPFQLENGAHSTRYSLNALGVFFSSSATQLTNKWLNWKSIENEQQQKKIA